MPINKKQRQKMQLQKIRQNLLAIRSGATPAEMSERMRELCNANGYDPVYELVELIRVGIKVETVNSNGVKLVEFAPISVKDQVAIHKEMLKYIYPQLKSVDIQQTIDATVNVTVKQYDVPYKGNCEVIDANFSMIADKIEENVKKVKKDA